MTVLEYLNQQRCRYEITHHKPAYTAEQLARLEKVPSRQVAKSVVIEADGRFYLCVLPADRKIDFASLQRHLKTDSVRLADERQMQKLFADAEIGAEAPFGNLYELPTLMDKSLQKDKEIVFLADSHETSVHLSMKEYKRLAKPVILKFSYPAQLRQVLDPFYFDPYTDNPLGI